MFSKEYQETLKLGYKILTNQEDIFNTCVVYRKDENTGQVYVSHLTFTYYTTGMLGVPCEAYLSSNLKKYRIKIKGKTIIEKTNAENISSALSKYKFTFKTKEYSNYFYPSTEDVKKEVIGWKYKG